MEKYQLVKAEYFHKDFIIKLNSENMPAVGKLSEESYNRFLKYSDYFKLVKYDNQFIGFMIGLLPNRPYESVNYKWFEKKYKSFIYIDRIVISFMYQNKGFGSLFYDDLKNSFKDSSDLITCEVNIIPKNDISMKFHKKYGFKEVGQQSTENGKKLVSMQLLSLNKYK
tara:strand:+ start:218 stop:721 length:504 start_codon:yes stop_codon:yes gene_type:complete